MHRGHVGLHILAVKLFSDRLPIRYTLAVVDPLLVLRGMLVVDVSWSQLRNGDVASADLVYHSSTPAPVSGLPDG